MQFRLLGPLQVVGEYGRVVSVAAPKRRALLAMLLVHANEPVSVDRLVEALWGTEPPPAAIPSLHAHIARLRSEIGPVIRTTAKGYTISAGPDELDVRHFADLVTAARQMTRRGEAAQASTTYQRALGLWRGPALADVAGEDFAQGEIRRLEELRFGAVEERIEADMSLGRHRQVIAELEALVAEHPLRERPWGLLMQALYQTGRQADSLAAYRRLRAVLVEELGIEPSPELQQLQLRILRQDPQLGGAASGLLQTVIRLPVPLTGLTGRDGDRHRTAELVRTHRLVTLTGPGGVGKTRLAIAVAQDLVDDFPDGVLFVDLSGVRDPAAVMGAIGAVTGGGDRPAEVIGGRQILIALDNFEQVIEAAEHIVSLAQGCPNLRLLVTSRAPLQVRGEQQLEVRPLTSADAAALFEERARTALFAAGVREDETVDIVARLDGLPLAIELAAARLRVLSPRALRQGLEDRLALLTAGRRDAPRRHRTMRETIAWSYDLLDAPAQSVFRACSGFPGGFDLAAARAVAGADLDAIADLVDQSLLRRTDDRYSMLDTIREFAAETAESCGESEAIRDRHLAHFVERVRGVERESSAEGPMADNPWLALCRTERENLRAAFDRALETANRRATLELFWRVSIFWLITGAMDEGERWSDAVLAFADELDAPELVRAISIASEFPRYGGDYARAISLKRRGLGVARSISDELQVATLLDDITPLLAATGDFAEAHACIDEALPIRRAHAEEDPLGVPHTLAASAGLALSEGHPAAAASLVAQIAECERTMEPHPDWILESTWLKARTLLANGAEAQAAELFGRLVREAGAVTFLWPIIDSLNALARLATDADPQRAARLIGMADRIQAESRLATWDPVEREHTVSSLRDRLGERTLERLRAAGHALPINAMAAAVEEGAY